MKYIFIVNPNAGKGGIADVIKNDIAALPEKDDCEVILTEAPMHAARIVGEWCDAHPGERARFVACGGDGTINEVFTGAMGRENISVAVYPCGSGNDFIKVFGEADALKGDFSKYTNIESIINAPERKLDVMKANGRYCINVLNFGFDTIVAKTMNELRDKRGHGSKSDYTMGIVKALVTAMKTECTVTVDGEVINPRGNMLLCTFGNGRYVGGSFKCAPRGEIDDGLIEVCLVKPISRLKFVTLLAPYTEGKHLDNPDFDKLLVYRRGTKLSIDAKPGFAYSLDGEIIYAEHVDVEIIPGALSLAIPE